MPYYPSLWKYRLCNITRDFCHIFHSLSCLEGILSVAFANHRPASVSQDYVCLDHRPQKDTCEKLIDNTVHLSRFRQATTGTYTRVKCGGDNSWITSK